MQTTGTEFQAASARSRRLLAVATALGLLGGGLLLLYLQRFEEEVSGGARVQVLSVVQPLERGALITKESLAVSEVPVAYVERRAVRAPDRSKIIGIRAAHALDAQDTLMWTDLAITAESRDLSSLVQPGKRAVTVKASEAGSDPAGSGLLRPGDYVDVLVTLQEEPAHGSAGTSAVVLLQRVLVLAVGSRTEPTDFARGRDTQETRHNRERELTLSLKTEEVQLLSLARERGTLSVALRDPSDTKIVEGIPDMPVSVLFDKKSRESVQRRRTDSPLPVRLTQSEP